MCVFVLTQLHFGVVTPFSETINSDLQKYFDFIVVLPLLYTPHHLLPRGDWQVALGSGKAGCQQDTWGWSRRRGWAEVSGQRAIRLFPFRCVRRAVAAEAERRAEAERQQQKPTTVSAQRLPHKAWAVPPSRRRPRGRGAEREQGEPCPLGALPENSHCKSQARRQEFSLESG